MKTISSIFKKTFFVFVFLMMMVSGEIFAQGIQTTFTVDGNKVTVKMKSDIAISGTFSLFIADFRYLESYNPIFIVTNSNYSPVTVGDNIPDPNDPSYRLQRFAFSGGAISTSLTAGVEYPVFTFSINGGAGTGIIGLAMDDPGYSCLPNYIFDVYNDQTNYSEPFYGDGYLTNNDFTVDPGYTGGLETWWWRTHEVSLGKSWNTSGTTSDWSLASNWSDNAAPLATDYLTIVGGSTQPIFGAGAVCQQLKLVSGASAKIAYNGTLTVNGDLIIADDNAFIVKSTASGTGSLITNGTVPAANKVNVERYIAANEWHLISAPISDALSGMFVGKYLQTHSESTNEYTDIESLTEPLTPMKGFAVWNASGFTANYVGTLNTGNQSIATTKDGEGWNLVGNPYPSAIDWNAASGWTKTNVNATTYLHVNSSTWATWNGSTGTNGGSQYIAPGQGFFVEATGAGTLAMTDAVRVHNPVSFFKNTVNNLVRLQVSGNGYTDDAVVYFVPEATAEFDGQYDAHKLFGDVAEAAQIYTLGSSPLAINALPETNSVPVGIHAGASGTYTIAATEVNDIQAITLKDNQTGISTNLLANSYSFSFTPGENEQRFTLYFSPLSINEVENPLASIYSNQNTLYVDLKSLTKGDIYVYNLAGQLVTSASANQGMNMIRLTNTGNYIVKVIAPKTTLVKKVFIQ